MKKLHKQGVAITVLAFLGPTSGIAQTAVPSFVPVTIGWLGDNAPSHASIRVGGNNTPLACNASTRTCSGSVYVAAGRPTANTLAISFGSDDYALPIRLVQGQRNASIQLRYRTVANCHVSNVDFAAEPADTNNLVQTLEKWFVAFRLLKLQGSTSCDITQKRRAKMAVIERTIQLVDFSKGLFVLDSLAQLALPSLPSDGPIDLQRQQAVLAAYQNLLGPSEIRFISENQRLATVAGDFTSANALLQLNAMQLDSSPDTQQEFASVGLSAERLDRQGRELDAMAAEMTAERAPD